MSKFFKVFITLLFGLIIVSYIAVKLFWPKQWTINAPVVQQLTGFGSITVTDQKLLPRISLVPEFSINVYADHLGNPRALLVLKNGDILVSSPREGKIYRLLFDRNGDGRADGKEVLLANLNSPFGMDYHQGFLYLAETDAVIKVPYDIAKGRIDRSKLKRIIKGLPTGGHWTRTVKIGPDQKLYLTMGSSCNVCLEKDPRRAAMLRYNLDGSNEQIFASGLRNTVGFAWQPTTNNLYGVDNGRDLLGDNFPPDELNQIVQGGFYGWPFLNGDNVKDPDFGSVNDPRIAKAIKPAHKFGAHTAPLGITFLTASNTPRAYRNCALVTEHGSWNRSKKSGYQVVSLCWLADGTIQERPFLTGLMINEQVFGRPVDVVQAADGTIFVSDDFANVVYRISSTTVRENFTFFHGANCCW